MMIPSIAVASDYVPGTGAVPDLNAELTEREQRSLATGNSLPSTIDMMQVSELFRRGVVVPLDDRTAEQLVRWSVDDMARVEVLAIPDETLFEKIWEAGIFQALNQTCGSLIDDYEEEVLSPKVLESALTALTVKLHQIQNTTIHTFVENLIALCRLALEQKRPVYFVL